MKLKLFFFWILCAVGITAQERHMVIVIPSYNNARWAERNIVSAITQNYNNFHVIFIDDCSSDQTFEIVKRVVSAYNQDHRVTLIKNSRRMGAMLNLYNAIHSCPDDAIIVTLDGDDWLSSQNVLNYLNFVYQHSNVWLTFGQFVGFPSNAKGFCVPFEPHIIRSNAFRKTRGALPMSHLRTFEAWLFKRVKLIDFLYQGQFLSMAWDKAMMAPMVEMAGERHKCIQHDILYIYNETNPINDHKVDRNLQKYLADMILAKPPYSRLPEQITITQECKDKKTSLLVHATDAQKTIEFVTRAIETIKNLHSIEIVANYQIADQLENYYHNNNTSVIININRMFISLSGTVNQVLDALESHYVIVTHDNQNVDNGVDAHRMIYELERTRAGVYVLEKNIVNKPDIIDLDTVNAWQMKFTPKLFFKEVSDGKNAYRVDKLKQCLVNNHFETITDLNILILKQMIVDDEVGIITKDF